MIFLWFALQKICHGQPSPKGIMYSKFNLDDLKTVEVHFSLASISTV